MVLRIQLEAISDKLFEARGECKWCTVYHKRGQCHKPVNASKRGPARLGSYEVLEANQIAGEMVPQFARLIQLEALKR